MIESEVAYREDIETEPSPVLAAASAFVAGAAVGAVLALLFAPQPGRETRDAIAQRVDAVAERIRAARRQLTQRLSAGGDFASGVFPGTPSQVETGTDYESGGNGSTGV